VNKGVIESRDEYLFPRSEKYSSMDNPDKACFTKANCRATRVVKGGKAKNRGKMTSRIVLLSLIVQTTNWLPVPLRVIILTCPPYTEAICFSMIQLKSVNFNFTTKRHCKHRLRQWFTWKDPSPSIKPTTKAASGSPRSKTGNIKGEDIVCKKELDIETEKSNEHRRFN
jgi:hypothetical protein